MKILTYLLCCCAVFVLEKKGISYPSLSPHHSSPQEGSSSQKGKRHFVFLRSDGQKIFGLYYFAVTNATQVPKVSRERVMVPKETLHFEPHEGLETKDLILEEDGDLYVQREFPPGLTLVGIGFETPVTGSGKTDLHFYPKEDLPSFAISSPVKDQLTLSGKNFSPGVSEMVGGGYQGVVSQGLLQKEEEFVISVSGTPLNRRRLWILAFSFFSIFLAVSFGFALKTRPELGSLSSG